MMTLLSQRKERNHTKKENRYFGAGVSCFGKRPTGSPKITTSVFYFLANGSAALLAPGQPIRGPDFYDALFKNHAPQKKQVLE
jgi:hypothetical protein